MYRLITLIAFSVFLYSCSTENSTGPKDDDDGGGSGVKVENVKSTFSSISSQIFDKRCSCHQANSPAAGLSLKAANAYDNIVGIQSSSGSNYIEPGNSNSSYLFLKLLGTGISGSRMPRDGATTGYLSQAAMDSIKAWIDNGALNN